MTQPTATEVLQTVTYDGFVKSLFNRSGDLSKDFTHAVLGIITESHEYLMATDMVNAIEEAGDLAFYLTALKQVLDDFSPTNQEEFEKLITPAIDRINQPGGVELDEHFTEWLDLAKRWIGYGKAPTMTTTQLLAEASALVNVVIEGGAAQEVDMRKIVLVNVEKLLKRYNGMTFDAERAVTRDLFAEREVLEANAI
jgi:hypothetical protein